MLGDPLRVRLLDLLRRGGGVLADHVVGVGGITVFEQVAGRLRCGRVHVRYPDGEFRCASIKEAGGANLSMLYTASGLMLIAPSSMV